VDLWPLLELFCFLVLLAAIVDTSDACPKLGTTDFTLRIKGAKCRAIDKIHVRAWKTSISVIGMATIPHRD
jgi:hypothetical protein